MLRKITTTTALLGAVLAFTLIGTDQARADELPFPLPFDGLEDIYPCLIEVEGEIVPCPTPGLVVAEPPVVVTIPLPEDVSLEPELPAFDTEPAVELPPSTEETDDSAADPAPVAEPEPAVDPETATEPEPVVETETVEELEPVEEEAATTEITISAEETTEDGESAEVNESAVEEQATAAADSAAQELVPTVSDGVNPLLAAALGALGLVVLVGAVLGGMAIGRRAN